MIRVMLVGPAPHTIGGIATVVGDILALDPADRVWFHHLPITLAASREAIHQRIGRHVGQLRRLATALRRHKIDLVHIHTCSEGSFFRSALDLVLAKSVFGGRRRVIVHIHGGRFEEFYHQRGPVGRWIIRSTLNYADAVVALSKTWADRIGVIAPRARVEVIENACPRTDEGSPAESSRGLQSARTEVRGSFAPIDDERCQREPRACRFVMISRLDREKGVLDLLDAAQVLLAGSAHSPAWSSRPCHPSPTPQVPFTLQIVGPAGSAGSVSELQRQVVERGLGGAVEVSGAVLGSQKARVLAAADVFVLPSHAEGMPICVLEAMEAGLPTIATRVGALPEMIESGGDGLLVESADVAALADAMGTLALDPALRRRLGTRARQTVRNRFGLQRMRDRLFHLYERVAAEQVAPPASRGLPSARTEVRGSFASIDPDDLSGLGEPVGP